MAGIGEEGIRKRIDPAGEEGTKGRGDVGLVDTQVEEGDRSHDERKTMMSIFDVGEVRVKEEEERIVESTAERKEERSTSTSSDGRKGGGGGLLAMLDDVDKGFFTGEGDPGFVCYSDEVDGEEEEEEDKDKA
jgi:hypothetical protein